MYSANLEQKLILPDIDSVLLDFVSIQEDIDNTRLKAAQYMAMQRDLKRLIKKENLDRCVAVGQILYDGNLSLDELPISDGDTPDSAATITQADKDLFELIVPPLCYFTYTRLLLNFHGTYTESGWTQEELGEIRNNAKSVAKEMKGVAEDYMTEVIEFLQEENPSDCDISTEKMTSRVRVMGGKEYRGRYNNLNNSGNNFSRNADPYYIPNN